MDGLETISFNIMTALLGISAAMMTSAGTFVIYTIPCVRLISVTPQAWES